MLVFTILFSEIFLFFWWHPKTDFSVGCPQNPFCCEAVRKKRLGPVVLGRDHHDVSGTDSPYREVILGCDNDVSGTDSPYREVIQGVPVVLSR